MFCPWENKLATPSTSGENKKDDDDSDNDVCSEGDNDSDICSDSDYDSDYINEQAKQIFLEPQVW